MPSAHKAPRVLAAVLVALVAACGGSEAAPETSSAASALAAGAGPPDTLTADTLRIDGSAGVAPLVEALARDYRASRPAVAIQMGGGLGSKARIEALDRGAIDIAMASHGVDVAALARQGLAAHEIARVAVVFAVDSSVRVSDLSARQLCDIYAGSITNWKALGGADLPIVPLMRPVGEVDADVVLAGIGCLARAAEGRTLRVLQKPDEMAAALRTTSGAIGMTSMPFVEGSEGRIRALSLGGVAPSAENVRLGRHALTRQSFLLVRAAPSPEVARFLAFVRGDQGARVIAASAAVPVP